MISIDNKEWFDSNGNTCFSADVYLNNDLIMSMPMQYGYNQHCEQVLNKALRKHFNIDPKASVYETLVKNGIRISVTTRDVKKRDLNKDEAFQDFSAFTKPENLALYAAHRMRQGIALKHPVMENVFIDWLNQDSVGITYADGSNGIYQFTDFDWF